jgi:hypothetical protein
MSENLLQGATYYKQATFEDKNTEFTGAIPILKLNRKLIPMAQDIQAAIAVATIVKSGINQEADTFVEGWARRNRETGEAQDFVFTILIGEAFLKLPEKTKIFRIERLVRRLSQSEEQIMEWRYTHHPDLYITMGISEAGEDLQNICDQQTIIANGYSARDYKKAMKVDDITKKSAYKSMKATIKDVKADNKKEAKKESPLMSVLKPNNSDPDTDSVKNAFMSPNVKKALSNLQNAINTEMAKENNVGSKKVKA